MSRKKLQRYQEVKTIPNYFDELIAPKGNWGQRVFKNSNPIVLELGCGYGEYVVYLAHEHPQTNFVGVDVKSERMYMGLREVNHAGLKNAAFFRIPIQFLGRYFNPGEVDELWITFPDPFLKEKKHRRRLTSAYFLSVYRTFLKDGGIINFKTDNTVLYEYTLEVLEEEGSSVEILYQNRDVYSDKNAKDEWKVPSRYEQKFLSLGETIKLIQFKLFRD